VSLAKDIVKDIATGVVVGLIIGDKETVFPIDMVAIPAFQAHMITGTPSMQVYIKAGETLVPTGGNVADMKENMSVETVSEPKTTKKTRKKGGGLPRKFAKMGLKKGWAAYKKTPAYKKKVASKKKKSRRKK